MLSNELLGLILSFMTMKEAGATSILSRRWKYLWTLMPRLDLDGAESLKRMMRKSQYEDSPYKEFVVDNERSDYIRWVDRVVAVCSTTSTTLEEFRVFFDLTTNHAKHIDEWLRFALSRKVQRLQLKLRNEFTSAYGKYYECYNFPYKKGNFPNDFKFIKKLSTNCVNVSGEALELFLRNCPLLEQVSVSQSSQLKALKIIRTFPSFKCLEISLCHNLRSVVIRDSNVMTIKYGGKRILDFQLMNVPLLTQLWINGPLTDNMKHVVEMFSHVLPQLEMFKIYYMCKKLLWNETKEFLSAVRMCNLKELVVNVWGLYDDRDSLLPLINLISASPCLRRFVLEAPDIQSEHENNLFESCCAARKILRHYPHLKEVEFVGYRGGSSHFELIMHFVENYVAPENIVVDPRCFELSLDHPWDRIFRPKNEEEMFAWSYAKKQLKEYVHPRINVKML
ncbi:hypothetical protein C2S53_013849 [Perilla frutescens var. hirtella]|uniref:FBD domain-containing protein n=1 Tax=Perilla frutescens var. hirtella TaxID=608512 RepID=A0AAD4IMP3_PERFH|nr:hypothetical protein C2S53_013849 [Perilla frutescens var. hirtella]